MPSDPNTDAKVSGRCDCGAQTVSTARRPVGVTYFHCPDCLPGPVAHMPLGLLGQTADSTPSGHSQAGYTLPWRALANDLPRPHGSGHDRFKATHIE